MPVGHLYVFFGEMSISVFCPFFDLVVCFSGIELYECIYILEINPLSVVSFAIIFSHSEGCRFTLLIVSFALQKLLSLIRASLVAQRLKHLPAMQETHVQSLDREDPLEKEMATHFSILAWRIPWMEEPGRLQSMGSQKVRHD